MTLSDIIIAFRNKHELSQRQFADMCNVSNAYISLIESGINPKTGKPLSPSLLSLRKIAKGMNMTLDELFAKADELEVDISGDEAEEDSADEIAQDSFANRLKEALAMRNMKQIELAEKTNLGRSAISQYVSGKYEPKQEGVYKIAKALNVSEAWLMGFDVPIERGEDLKAMQDITFNDFTFAFHNETKNLTDAEKELLLSMARKLNEARKVDGKETD